MPHMTSTLSSATTSLPFLREKISKKSKYFLLYVDTEATNDIYPNPYLVGGHPEGLRECQKMTAVTERQNLSQHRSGATMPSSVLSI
ncbi:hypothetical protein EVAR_66638_1 [Eumeta japonica]|uniref:Uncharacterized protein n=1 Tax=Eumeta variegata TaxID=151549 RepID=A0A4C1ZZU2_EUMVA|nr:hypothetical protein EVAR_66638_1 [Eumeta japonica]